MALELNYSASGVIAVNTVLMSQDADGQRGFAFQVVSLGTSGVLKVQQSQNGTTWVDALVQSLAGGSPAGTVNAAGLYWSNVHARYVRVILSTATTAGTTTVAARLSSYELPDMVRGMPSLAVSTLPATPAGTNVMGGTFCTLSATAAQGAALLVSQLASAAASTNATLVKSSAGRIAKIRGYNAAAAVRYLKLYNKATAPVPGTDTAFMQIPLKPADMFDFDVDALGVSFGTGIGYAITTGSSLTDATAVTAADVVGLTILYV